MYNLIENQSNVLIGLIKYLYTFVKGVKIIKNTIVPGNYVFSVNQSVRVQFPA